MFIDLTGRRFGKLIVINRTEDMIYKSGTHVAMWECLCDCGNEKIIAGTSLKSGCTKSCGCYHMQRITESNSTHKKSNTRLYRIWKHMIDRCNNNKSDAYKYYGGRGISICKDWHNIELFFEWSFCNGYDDSLTLDRLDTNGNYDPENCRWATRKEQANNTSRNVNLFFNGKTQNISQWASETGIKFATIWSRLKLGWNIEDALTKPVKHREVKQ